MKSKGMISLKLRTVVSSDGMTEDHTEDYECTMIKFFLNYVVLV